MPLTYTNRRQETYYARAVRAKKGGVRYYIVKDYTRYPPEEILEAMPEGYEWYEYPEDGKTTLRKIVPTQVPPAMLETVREVVTQYSPLQILRFDVEPDAVTVYEYPYGPDEMGMSTAEILRFVYLLPVLRFALLPGPQYQVQRQCHYPGLEGWITMETSPDLEALAAKFAPHIGQESLLDFWVEGEEDF
ncbi:hypothetical protein [Hymenobacter weizhouensis]|uniref:hypothetical protein n=1 Tax=Hymenobacter sp. YIM 151500-1 TaxID=2987689 RepID=UPI002226AC70|nr:hypothetical protein [Hymenobacter sp. YIM 151500-1]UYZ63771.1 hypothetical protein OIS53_02760 [Hymenobacter sp. YIM 151500-1]